jgi:hypothetical protein
LITEPRLPDPVLAGLVGRLLASDALAWRHHKIGLLQAYVAEGQTILDTELRLHVWHPDLILSDEDSGRIHDHRFRLTSQVLLGAMHDTEIKLHDAGVLPERDPDFVERMGGVYEVWDIQNARRAQADGQHWVAPSTGQPGKYLLERTDHVYSMGARYSYPPRVFHRSNVKELTVTICTKRDQADVPARLLARVGATPKHAFDPTPAHGGIDEKYRGLLREASRHLLDIARTS